IKHIERMIEEERIENNEYHFPIEGCHLYYIDFEDLYKIKKFSACKVFLTDIILGITNAPYRTDEDIEKAIKKILEKANIFVENIELIGVERIDIDKDLKIGKSIIESLCCNYSFLDIKEIRKDKLPSYLFSLSKFEENLDRYIQAIHK